MTNPYQTRGFEAADGTRFIQVRAQDQAAVVPHRAFSVTNRQLEATLEHLHIAVFDKPSKEALIAEVKSVTCFEPAEILNSPGWAGDGFVLANGTVIEPPHDRAPIVTFAPDRTRLAQAGTLDEWKAQIAISINRQRIAMLAVMAALAPPMLRFMPHAENIVIELVGGHGSGKSTVVGIASSVMGGNGTASTTPYAVPLATLMSDPRSNAQTHRDHPILIEGVDVYAGQVSDKEIRRAYNFLANELPSLWRSGPSSQVRTMALLTGRESLRTLAGMANDEDADGLITLRVPANPHRIFNSLPEGFNSASAFADAMTMAAAHNHGSAFRALVDHLAKLSADQRASVSERLAKWQKRFLERVAAQDETLAGSRTARALATIYAVGKYAQRLKILPAEWNCLNAALQCLKQSNRVKPAVKPFAVRLEDLVASERCLTVSADSDQAHQAVEANARGATLWRFPDYREVRIASDRIAQFFPDWPLIKKSNEVQQLLVRSSGDGKRLNDKKPLAPGEPTNKRLYRFRLPPEAAAPEDSIFDPERLLSDDNDDDAFVIIV